MIIVFTIITFIFGISNSQQDRYDIEMIREERKAVKEMRHRRNKDCKLEVALPNKRERE